MNAKAWFYSQSFNGRAEVKEPPKQVATKDNTEYCEECRCYHERPTWPKCDQWRKGK